jgi:RNA polymerase sigma-70 factor (ECF subfamily)
MDKLSNKIHIDNEKEIIRKVLEGETTIFEILVRRTNSVLYKIGRTYGFNHQDAEDLVQETHITAFNELDSFQGLSSYKTWVSRIMIHKCLYKLNHGYSKNEVSAKGFSDSDEDLHHTSRQDPHSKIQNHELSRILEASIQALPLPYKTVFVLRQVEGFSVSETADLLNITPVNVKVRLNRAKVMLRKLLEQYYTSTDLFELTLPYCDEIVDNVFGGIKELAE